METILSIAKTMKNAMDIYGPAKVIGELFGTDDKCFIPIQVELSIPTSFLTQHFSTLPLNRSEHEAAGRIVGDHGTIFDLMESIDDPEKTKKKSCGEKKTANIKSHFLNSAYEAMNDRQRLEMCMKILEENCNG